MNELQDAALELAAITLEVLDKEMDEAREQTEEARKWAIYYKKKYEDAQANHDLWVEDVFYKENDE